MSEKEQKLQRWCDIILAKNPKIFQNPSKDTPFARYTLTVGNTNFYINCDSSYNTVVCIEHKGYVRVSKYPGTDIFSRLPRAVFRNVCQNRPKIPVYRGKNR